MYQASFDLPSTCPSINKINVILKLKTYLHELNAVKLYDIEHISYISKKDLSSQSEDKFLIFTIKTIK